MTRSCSPEAREGPPERATRRFHPGRSAAGKEHSGKEDQDDRPDDDSGANLADQSQLKSDDKVLKVAATERIARDLGGTSAATRLARRARAKCQPHVPAFGPVLRREFPNNLSGSGKFRLSSRAVAGSSTSGSGTFSFYGGFVSGVTREQS